MDALPANTSMSISPAMESTIPDAAPYKIALLLVAGLSVHLSLSPPNPPVPAKQCLSKKTLFERCVRWVTFCSKMMVWAATLSDAYATYVVAGNPASPFDRLQPSCRHPAHLSPSLPNFPASPVPLHHSVSTSLTNSHPLLVPSSLLLFGTLSVVMGALLRLWCFRTLGPFFTFELTIHPSHTLVTTGPYAIVRHPSYTGIYLTLLGASAVALAPGSWLRECWLATGNSQDSGTLASMRWMRTLGSAQETAVSASWLCGTGFSLGQAIVCLLITFWSFKVWYALRSTHQRLHVEDVELHKVFGETWEAYARRVRWKLVPGVF